ncbi:MAG TPA: tyrosine-type recombinase/integrase [Candidatus Ruthenibacterium avium]|uniref:Tyrosine-type recombinase/integrase n=1 Tax=Candidatus Ruthenibacterium avium TaxID=2838751 RepID=A0A9D2S173_9FIRM|nr:tyrosine-type recombinase/integrase [Candidatus Ruthenibacterium avium]
MANRKDNKGRLLKTGESQRQDGRYAFKYRGKDGKDRFIYSWRLNDTDPLPKGKRQCKSLRELEKELQRDLMDGIDATGKKMLLWQLYEKHNALKPNVRKATVQGRKMLLNILKTDELGNMPIDKIKPSDTKQWAFRMSKKYSYQTINNHKRSLTACFHTAINDDLVRKNPFAWALSDVLKDDTVHKTALTEEQSDALVSFVKMDSTYQRYCNAIIVILYTGLRISELCGLTVRDIDFENGFICVNHQLLHDKEGYRVTSPKTDSGIRKIPLLAPAREALLNEIESRINVQAIEIDGYSDFVFLNKKGYPMYAAAYDTAFNNLVRKYNKHHKATELPMITPHMLRHTFCTNMANKKMTPNTLQYIMGHKNIMMTLGYYTHGTPQSAMAEMQSFSA